MVVCSNFQAERPNSALNSGQSSSIKAERYLVGAKSLCLLERLIAEFPHYRIAIQNFCIYADGRLGYDCSMRLPLLEQDAGKEQKHGCDEKEGEKAPVRHFEREKIYSWLSHL